VTYYVSRDQSRRLHLGDEEPLSLGHAWVYEGEDFDDVADCYNIFRVVEQARDDLTRDVGIPRDLW